MAGGAERVGLQEKYRGGGVRTRVWEGKSAEGGEVRGESSR